MNDVTVEDMKGIGARILTIRGVPVMLDRDLAALYRVPTKALNQAVKRNLERFPERFMFQLGKEELDYWKSQIVTSRLDEKERAGIEKGLRRAPYAFTEQGVAMLSAVLHGPVAVQVSLRIMDAFVALRRTVQAIAPSLASISVRLEANEQRQIAAQKRNEARFDEIFARMAAGEAPAAQIFYQGRFWDAKSLLIRIIRRAKRKLVVIDAYPGVATLDMLAKRGRGVQIELVTHSNGELAETDFEAFGRQCGHFTKTLCGTCHDRFLVVDEKELYWCGASLKDAGRLTFAVAQMGATAIPGLLDSIRRATATRVEYA